MQPLQAPGSEPWPRKVHFRICAAQSTRWKKPTFSKSATYGWGRQGLIPLWFGEGDVPTPEHICEAAAASMLRGETFYTDQNGIEELRSALAGYHRRAFGVEIGVDRLTITNSA